MHDDGKVIIHTYGVSWLDDVELLWCWEWASGGYVVFEDGAGSQSITVTVAGDGKSAPTAIHCSYSGTVEVMVLFVEGMRAVKSGVGERSRK